MPRKRNTENEGLPKRWAFQHGAYYYQVPSGFEKNWDGKKKFRLGKTLPEAYKEWANRLEYMSNAKTVNELLDRYALEIVPTKALSTQTYNVAYIQKLRSAFGKMHLEDIEPTHIYQYVDRRRKKKTDKNGKIKGGLSIAKREIAMFSDAYTKAVQWGYIRKHPFKGEVVLEGEKGRDRYIENWELAEFMSIKPKHKKDSAIVIQAYTNLKLISGLRQQDLLNLKVSDLKEDDPDNNIIGGIHVTPIKTRNSSGKSIIIKWSPALREAIDIALTARPVDISPYVFCTRRGKSYYDPDKAESASGWKSIWRRYMDRILQETKLEEKFTEHDLRAKTASDLDDIEHAQKLLAHTSKKMTGRYIRRPQVVTPAR